MQSSVIIKTIIYFIMGTFMYFFPDSELGIKFDHGSVAVPAEQSKRPSPATHVRPRSKTKYKSTKEADKSKVVFGFWIFSYLLICGIKCSKILVGGCFTKELMNSLLC